MWIVGTHRAALASLVCLIASLGAESARAALTTSTRAYCAPGLVQPAINNTSESGASACSFNISQPAGSVYGEFGTTGSATATTTAGPRKVGVQVNGSITLATDEPRFVVVMSRADITLTEAMQMSAADANGGQVQSGTMDINMLASGILSITSSGPDPELQFIGFDAAKIALSYQLTVPGIVSSGGSREYKIFNPGPHAVGDGFSVTVPWISGQAITTELAVAGVVELLMRNDGFINGSVSFGNSLDWLGISNVRDSNGNPVPDFLLLGDNGAVWGRDEELPPVPLPGTLAMALTALVPVMLRLRRRMSGRLAVELNSKDSSFRVLP